MPDHIAAPLAPAAAPSILIVDDDVELCGLLEDVLTRHGFRLAFAHDGPSGLERALSGSYDLVILDVMLPLLDGFEVLRQLRRRARVPVIMLTARAEERDRIEGLESGADDYVLKPFATGELLARIRAVRRRVISSSPPVPADARAGPVRISPLTGRAWISDRLLDLTSIELTLLDLLVREAGRIVSRDEITAVLYQRQAGAHERALDVHMSHLRKKLEPHGADLIRTVRSVGYMFVLTE